MKYTRKNEFVNLYESGMRWSVESDEESWIERERDMSDENPVGEQTVGVGGGGGPGNEKTTKLADVPVWTR